MKNVLLIKGISQYDAMRYYIDEIETGFRLAGYHTIVIDGAGRSVNFQLCELKQTVKIDYIFTCNAIFTGILTEFPDAVYLTYLCDHPAFHKERLEELREKDIVFLCDDLYAAYVREFYDNVKNAEFIPLSGGYSKKYIPYAKRNNEVVFTGSYEKPEAAYQRACMGCADSLKPFLEYMLKDIIEHPHQTLDMCLRKALEQFGIIDVPKCEFHELVGEFREVDAYARTYYRDKMIRVLVESGILVHVFGSGWENFESRSKENLIIEKGNAYVAQKAVANARISLNIMPWFKAGFQERIASAMLSGTVAVTDESTYINQNFEDGKELVLYSLEHLEELPDKVKYLLEHEEAAAEIADSGKKRAHQGLTWQHQTFAMIDYMRQCEKDKGLSEHNAYGQVLQIPYQHLQERAIGQDAIKEIDELLENIRQLQTYDKVDLCDIEYLYKRFLFLFLRTRANFPDLTVSDFAYEQLMDKKEKDIAAATELLIMECTRVQAIFLKAECESISREKELACQANRAVGFSNHEQEVLIEKIVQKYAQNMDADIREILQNIREKGYVDSYNQNFVKKYTYLTEKQMDEVQFDEAAQMHYVYWNGKKMYYPKSYSRENAARAANFARLEQDMESPHRYVTEDFCVEDGDIVIDAGVAEGNFALDIVERAKKVYLVECEHTWIEALEKTFEPWKEKVVIIEKMLADYEDDTHAAIDAFVKEQQVNFIKMDVEGAELASLTGASNVIRNSRKIRCAICAYHRKNDARDIRMRLEQDGFYTSITKGYIFFKNDIESWVEGELRRGMIRAVKQI